jgi:hypothetical protein
MLEQEYKAYLLEQEINQLMANPLEVMEKHIFNPCGEGRNFSATKISGVVQRSEEAALYYVNNTPHNRSNRDILAQCAKWRSCADLIFPNLRRYLDDEVRNEIIAKHSDYSVFALKALEMDVSDDEIKGLVYALVSNIESVEQGLEYIRKYDVDTPWKFNIELAKSAYTSEKIAWEVVKEFPKTIVFSSASHWISLASRMIRSREVDHTVHLSCMREHIQIASDFVNSNHHDTLFVIFHNHPTLRERILRRKDLTNTGYFNATLRNFRKFQDGLQKTLQEQQKLVG